MGNTMAKFSYDINFTQKQKIQISKLRTHFFYYSALMSILLFGGSMFLGDAIIMALLKMCFGPIYMIATIAIPTFFPKNKENSLLLRVANAAMQGLLFAFLLLVLFVTANKSIESLGATFAFTFLGYSVCTFGLGIYDDRKTANT